MAVGAMAYLSRPVLMDIPDCGMKKLPSSDPLDQGGANV